MTSELAFLVSAYSDSWIFGNCIHDHDLIHCEICIHKLSSFIFLTSMYVEIGISSDEFQQMCCREDATKQEKCISHQLHCKGRGSQHSLHICLYQHCWAPGLGNKNSGWCKHRPTASEGRDGIRTTPGAWPPQIDGPWHYPPEDVKSLMSLWGHSPQSFKSRGDRETS